MQFRLCIQQNSLNPALARALNALGKAGMKRVHHAAGLRFWQMTRDNFGQSGTWRPAPWPQLSPRYQKQINYFGPPKLLLKRSLIDSIQWRYDERHAELFTESPYAAVHQFGGGNNIPPRPYFPVANGDLTPAARQQIVGAIEREVAKLLIG